MENIILYNSRELFYELGYFKTTIKNITKKCGISTGKFYQYYQSKEDLLMKVIKKDMEIYEKELKNLIPEHGGNKFKADAFAAVLLNFLKKNPSFFNLIFELGDIKDKLSPSVKKLERNFWNETKNILIELLDSNGKIDENKRELLASLLESEMKIYIKYLLTGKNKRFLPGNLTFLDVKHETTHISAMILNTFKSLDLLYPDEITDPLTGAYVNKYFFQILDETRSTGASLQLIFLDFTDFFLDDCKSFFRDSLIKDIGVLLKTHFRDTDSIGRLCPYKFMIFSPMGNIPFETISSRVESIVTDLKIKYPFIESEGITQKNLHISPGEDILKKFSRIKSVS